MRLVFIPLGPKPDSLVAPSSTAARCSIIGRSGIQTRPGTAPALKTALPVQESFTPFCRFQPHRSIFFRYPCNRNPRHRVGRFAFRQRRRLSPAPVFKGRERIRQREDRMFHSRLQDIPGTNSLSSMIKFFPTTGPRRPSFRAQRSGDPESRRSAEAHGSEAFEKQK